MALLPHRAGARIGAHCSTADIEDYALVVGVPGRPVGWMSRHGHRLRFDAAGLAVCVESGLRDRLEAGRVRCLDVDEEAALPAALAEGYKPYDAFQEGR